MPPRKTDPAEESELQIEILELMKDGKIWENSQLKSHIGKKIHLQDKDKKVGARPNEQLWENRVNNALSPSRSNSLYAKGFIENVGRGRHKITTNGLNFINESEININEFLQNLKP